MSRGEKLNVPFWEMKTSWPLALEKSSPVMEFLLLRRQNNIATRRELFFRSPLLFQKI